jgi:hypothetical protein
MMMQFFSPLEIFNGSKAFGREELLLANILAKKRFTVL